MRGAILTIGLWIASTFAFVTLDTSFPRDSAEIMSGNSGTALDTASEGLAKKSLERVGTVLFLSGDDQRVYAAIGLLRALQDSGLAPDMIVAEGAAAIPAAAYALGYKMEWLDSLFRVHPLEFYLGGEFLQSKGETEDQTSLSPKQDEEGPLPWERNLATGQVKLNRWVKESISPHQNGRLALSWLMARLLRGAPSESAGIPIAFQLVEAKTGNVILERPGEWQSLVLAAALKPGPAAAAQRRPVWIAGNVISQGQPLAEHWPVQVGSMVVLEVPATLEAKSFVSENLTALDSMRSRWNASSVSPQGTVSCPRLSLTLNPLGDLESSAAWVEMGYQAGRQSMQPLRSVFHTRTKAPENPSRFGNEALLWSNASFTARGAGYFQLLKQRVRILSQQGEPEDWIPELEESGFYSDIDVEWAERNGADGAGGLVLGAQEDPRVLISAGASLRIMGETMLHQVPEGMVSLIWAEPHYLPFKVEGAWLAGGNHPGFGGQLLVEPPAPFWTRLSAYSTRQSNRFEVPYSDWRHAGAIPIYMQENRSGFRLGIGPTRGAKLLAEIRRTVLDNLAVSPDPSIMDDGFSSTDFMLTLRLKFGESPGPQLRRLEITSSYVDPDNEIGLVRPGFSLHRADFEADYGPWEVFGQGQYADRIDLEWDSPFTPDWPDAYALWLMPPLQPFSYGNEVMVTRWRHFRYALAGGGLHYTWQKFAGRMVGGEATYMRLNGNPFQETRSYFPFWEGGISLQTGLGPFRLACSGFGDSGPFFSLQWGTRLNLDKILLDSEL